VVVVVAETVVAVIEVPVIEVPVIVVVTDDDVVVDVMDVVDVVGSWQRWVPIAQALPETKGIQTPVARWRHGPNVAPSHSVQRAAVWLTGVLVTGVGIVLVDVATIVTAAVGSPYSQVVKFEWQRSVPTIKGTQSRSGIFTHGPAVFKVHCWQNRGVSVRVVLVVVAVEVVVVGSRQR